jgi:hypothetical protein
MKLDWDSGGSATFLTLKAPDRVTLSSSVAAAPGTPLTGKTEEGVRYSVKVRTCKKLTAEPLAYWIDGRLFNVTRPMREALAGVLDAKANPGSENS